MTRDSLGKMSLDRDSGGKRKQGGACSAATSSSLPLHMDRILLAQKKRMRLAHLRARYAEAEEELDAEITHLKLRCEEVRCFERPEHSREVKLKGRQVNPGCHPRTCEPAEHKGTGDEKPKPGHPSQPSVDIPVSLPDGAVCSKTLHNFPAVGPTPQQGDREDNDIIRNPLNEDTTTNELLARGAASYSQQEQLAQRTNMPGRDTHGSPGAPPSNLGTLDRTSCVGKASISVQPTNPRYGGFAQSSATPVPGILSVPFVGMTQGTSKLEVNSKATAKTKTAKVTVSELFGTSLGRSVKRLRRTPGAPGRTIPLPPSASLPLREGTGVEKAGKGSGVSDKGVRQRRQGNICEGVASSAGAPSSAALDATSTVVPSSIGSKNPDDAESTDCRAKRNPGAFTGLCVYAIRLGSISRKTVEVWTREVGRGGGRVTSSFEEGVTTHVVLDASVSLETLERYVRPVASESTGKIARGRVAGSLVGNATGERATTIPVIGSMWMVECLKRSTVVDVDGFLVMRPRSMQREAPAKISSADIVDLGDLGDSQEGGRGRVEHPRGRDGPSTDHIAVSKSPARIYEAKETEISSGGRPSDLATRPENAPGGKGGVLPGVLERRSKLYCQSGSSRGHRSHNEHAAKAMENLSEVYSAMNGCGDGWRERGFKRAASVLRGLGTEITRFDQLMEMKKQEPKRLRGIGNSVLRLLEEFYAEGKMGRLDGLSSDDRVRSLRAFNGVWGVGSKTAEELVSAGFRTIEDLRERGQDRLNRQQLIGLDRYEDLAERMPRSEAGEIEALVTTEAKRLCPGVQCQACGSYRRGKEMCGDVDVLIQPPEGHEDCAVLLPLLESLRSSGFITDDLSFPGPHKPGFPQSYMGVCKLPGEARRHRRIDIKLYPTSMFGFALLYFTGSGHFNRSMRYFARTRGLSLSDRGLSPVNRVLGKAVYRFPGYRCPREEDVFAALGLEWREPRDRGGCDVLPAGDGDAEARCGVAGEAVSTDDEEDEPPAGWVE